MRRIQRDSTYEDLIKSLTTGESAVFKEIWRLMLFAAALGVSHGKRLPIQKSDSGKAIPDTYFSAPGWHGLLYLIGVAESGDSACLRGTEESQDFLVTAFEEYANYGLSIISSRMKEGLLSELDCLVALCIESNSAKLSDVNLTDLI